MMTSGAGSSIETMTNMNILIKNIIESVTIILHDQESRGKEDLDFMVKGINGT